MACMCGAADCRNCRDLTGEPVRACACCDAELDHIDAAHGNLVVDGDGVAWCWDCFRDECEHAKEPANGGHDTGRA
jgi:hypothetical protein